MISEFKILEHQADVRILAKGDNFVSLFKAALNGLCKIMLHDVKVS